MALEARLEERLGLEVQTIYSDDGIAIRLPEGDASARRRRGAAVPGPRGGRGPRRRAGRRSRACSPAGSARTRPGPCSCRGAGPGTRTPLWQQRQRAADLLAVASPLRVSFPILVETYRECLADVFDLPALREVLGGVQRRELDRPQRRDGEGVGVRGQPAVRLRRGLHVRGRRAAGRAPGPGADPRPRPAPRAAGPGGAARAARPRRARRPRAEPPGARRRAPRDDRRPGPRPPAAARRPDAATRSGRGPPAGGSRHRSTSPSSRRRGAPSGRGSRGEERWIAMEDVARYRDGVGVSAPPGRAAGVPRPGGRGARRAARPVRADARAVPRRRARRGAGACRSASSTTRSTGWSPPGSLLSGEFRPGGAEREFCDPEVLRLLRRRSLARAAARGGAGRSRDAGAVPARVAGRRPVAVRDGERRLAVPRLRGPGAPRRGRRPARRPARSRPRSSSVTCCPRASRATSRGCSTSSARWARSPGSGGGASAATTGGSSCYRPGREAAPARRPARRRRTPGRPSSTSGSARTSAGAAPRSTASCSPRHGARTDREVLDALWDLVWAGEVTNDTFAPLRALRWKRPAKDSRPRPEPADVARAARGGRPLVAGRGRDRLGGGADDGADGRRRGGGGELAARPGAPARSGSMPRRLPCSSATAC